MNHGPPRGKWLFLSVLTLVVGGLGAFAIWAFAIRGEEAPSGEGPAAPLTQSERESLERFHAVATGGEIELAGSDLEGACEEVAVIVEATPFSPYGTSAYPGGGEPSRWSPLPDTAHWATASDLEALTSPGRVLRQAGLRSILSPDDSVDGYLSAVRGCYDRLFPALEAATA